MVKFIWKGNQPVPDGMAITQVYGILFTEDGRIMLRVDENDFHGLIGGSPESGETHEETLRREVYEEANSKISNLHYLGYQVVEGDGAPYAQLRYIAKLEEIGENRPDLDNGKLYGRLLVPMDQAGEVLDYGEDGKKIVSQAIELAKKFKIID